MAAQTLSRTKLNFGLLVLVALLGLVVWLSPENDVESEPPPSLSLLTPEDIRIISISNNNGPSFTMERTINGWRMTRPHLQQANSERIGMLLGLLTTPVYEQFEVDSEELAQFGLAPPKARLRLNEVEFSMGGVHPYNRKRYLGKGNTVYLTNDIFLHHLQARAEDFIALALLTGQSEITTIVTPNWRLERTYQKTQPWQLQPPRRVSMDRLVAKVSDWRNAQAVRVFRRAEKSPTGAQPVTIETVDETIEFWVLPDSDTRLLHNGSGLVYEIPALPALLALPNGDAP